VIQWFWDAPSVTQTYEACVDFTMSGSGTPASSPSSAPVSSAAPAVSAPSAAPAAASSLPDCETPPPPPPPPPASGCDVPPGKQVSYII